MLNDAAVSHFKKVYLAPGYTDLRRGIDGLASISLNLTLMIKIHFFVYDTLKLPEKSVKNP